jgi:cell wall-associated NlpC family hydrolase
MENDNSKDIANSLNKYTDYAHKGTNLLLDSAENINKWYQEQLNKITEGDVETSRIETGVDNTIDTEDNISNNEKEISTKVKKYSKIQTNNNKKLDIPKTNKIQTASENNNAELTDNDKNETIIKNNKGKLKVSKGISTAIKGAKLVNNSAQRVIRTGKDISTGLNENGITTFKSETSRIMTKPIRKVGRKITKKTLKYTKKLGKKIGKKVITKTTNVIVKIMKLITKLVVSALKLIISMLPQIAPILIIIVIIAAFCSFFGIGMSEDTRKNYETYMINIQNEYDKSTVEFYNSGKVVDGTIEGKGMINWKAPLSIIQMLNGDLSFDDAEKELLQKFKDSNLFEKIEDVTYTYEKEVENTNRDGTVTKTKVTVTETKKIVTNPSLNSYIDWCNSNFSVINNYKKKKKVKYDSHQTRFTDNEVEQIKLLYNSTSFFDLFSADFQSTYAYLNVNISDEQIQKIYEEFLANAGKRYLMDHSNLKYDTCMDYYDCSSWVIHCLAHTGIKQIPNTGAEGIYRYHCSPISVEDRKAGDLIFLKNTYGNFPTEGIESITHIGIYMGELTINGQTEEWIIDTGGNPSGVRIRKYKDGWWNGSHFYGFGRLK